MAEEKKPDAAAASAEAAPAAGKPSFLPLILAIVLLPALGFAMTKFVLVPQLQKSLGVKESAEGGAHGEKAKHGAEGKKMSVQLSKLLVNIAGTGASRYLVSSVTVVSAGGEEFKKKMEENDPQIRDMVMSTLERKTLADLEKPGARNLIRTELINGINSVLGDAAVTELYITEFAIQ
jgi:flagellar basal body-associated protein FliL